MFHFMRIFWGKIWVGKDSNRGQKIETKLKCFVIWLHKRFIICLFHHWLHKCFKCLSFYLFVVEFSCIRIQPTSCICLFLSLAVYVYSPHHFFFVLTFLFFCFTLYYTFIVFKYWWSFILSSAIKIRKSLYTYTDFCKNRIHSHHDKWKKAVLQRWSSPNQKNLGS
jgi:hypothetical protein